MGFWLGATGKRTGRGLLGVPGCENSGKLVVMACRIAGLAVVVGLAGSVLGCGEAEPEPLRIAAASDLQTALPIVAARFRQDTGIRIEPTFGSSGQLAQQIRQGAPFDVFLAANREYVEDLEESGAIEAGSVRPYARGSLVMAVHGDVGKWFTSLEDLSKPAIKKVALANPEFAPYGRAARQALESAGLWEEIQPKLAQAESVRQALQFVESGNAEVGLVSLSNVDSEAMRVVPVDPDLYESLVQSMGVVKTSKRRKDARAFTDFLLGEVGQGMLADLGFRHAPEEEKRGVEPEEP
jgi:molybdate transport system substrate-binding protein